MADDRPTGVLNTLHRYFGHREFRTGQEELVSTVLQGQDLLAVMPTGTGKSLGFQLPAVMLPGVILAVVRPRGSRGFTFPVFKTDTRNPWVLAPSG